MSLDVRPARESDAAQMVVLLNPIIAAGGWTAMMEPVDEAGQAEFVGSFPRDGVFLVVEEGGLLLGMQDVFPLGSGVGEISTFVALDAHRKGVGSALMQAMPPSAKAKGITRLRAVILPSNPTALAFYYAMGFRKTAGGWPESTIAERSTEVVVAKPSERAVNGVLEKHMGGYFRPEREAEAVAEYGPAALEEAKRILNEALAIPMDWSKQTMDDGLVVLGQHLQKKYPWMSHKARSALAFAFTFTWK